ncbi:serine/threonine-protein kinase [Nannocystis punicea]|uniref:Serine/threonine-protein kinase n=1 Tax=Nannocystis punicea TaxID=2995304 RepID=A0ABY7HAM1_9BACT|nr:serine/threonine-protein kinase [Nannocystis poenicansa]WAS96329.1 serine/threonine-protein kinase [Nannocystis poenicansa]
MSSPADLTLDTPLTPVLSHVSPSPEAGTPLTPPVDGEPANDCAIDLEPLPSQIGRFNVLKRLGSGGMGVVYVAYDRDLDRKVALKVMRTAVVSRAKRDKARHRLMREAQAMAQLSHPNVIAIFDVGSVEDQIFFAMEFVKGVTLTKWLRSAEGPNGPRRRGWKEVLVVFMQAGRGLAAAHKAGIIHRDFKPDNVLIDAEGRVRVGDFGLARAGQGLGPLSRPDTYTEVIKAMAEKSLLDMRITRTGGMTGTPAYMAPEQYLGQATDARTDQFSFCVALYEGLYGQRPFVGDRVPVVREAVLAGRVQDVPKDTDVPAWLHRIVLRGLSVRPADRFKAMNELLDHLDETPRPRRLGRKVALAGGLAVAFAGAAFAVYDVVAARPEQPVLAGMCETPDLGWDEGRRAGLARALAERPGGAVFAGPTLAELDHHAQELRDMFQETCRNAQADAEAGGEAGARRRACLERRRSAFAGLARALSEASGPALDRAATALDALPAPRDCDDPRRLAAVVPGPEDDELRAQVARLRAELDHAGAVLALGDAPRAWDIARALAAADETWLPARAEALYGRAAIERALGRAEAAARGLSDALWAAEASRHDEVAADALTLQFAVECEDLGRRGEARRLWPRLSAALQRLGDDGRREASARGRYGRALLQEGDVETARVELTAALRRGEEILGVEHPRLLPILLDLAAACQRGGRDHEATGHVARAQELASARLPPEHPDRARVHVAAGDLARARGDSAAARQRYDDALAIYTEIYGQDHPDMSLALIGRGLAAAADQRWADAAGDLRRALAAWEHVLGPEHPRLVEPLTWLCAVDSALGEHAAAQGACARALALATRAAVPAQVALARFALAKARAAADLAAGETGPESRAQTVALARQALGEASAGGETALAAAISAWIAGQG